MKTAKKNRFLTFILSLIPGAAQMYMGFMKMGLSLMGVFFAIIALAEMLNISIMFFVSLVFWCYSFFHANNLAALNDEEFARIEDNYVFGADVFRNTQITAEKYRKYFGSGLIVLGIVLLWNISMNILRTTLYNMLPYYMQDLFWRISYSIPSFVVAIVVIIFGIKMLRGKKKSLPGESEEA
jgi:hypothetical protein